MRIRAEGGGGDIKHYQNKDTTLGALVLYTFW
jgi:hypothetical protein